MISAAARISIEHCFRLAQVLLTASYQYVWYGMGDVTKPRGTSLTRQQAEPAGGYFRKVATLTGKMLAALPDNRQLIGHIRRHGLPRI